MSQIDAHSTTVPDGGLAETGPIRITDDLISIKVILNEMIHASKTSRLRSRERDLLITKLEEAVSWATQALIVEAVIECGA